MDWNLIIYKVNDMKKNELINNRDYNIGDLIGRLPDVDMKYVKIIRDDDYYDNEPPEPEYGAYRGEE